MGREGVWALKPDHLEGESRLEFDMPCREGISGNGQRSLNAETPTDECRMVSNCFPEIAPDKSVTARSEWAAVERWTRTL